MKIFRSRQVPRPEFDPRLPRPLSQKDEYNQGRGKKTFGYPLGQPTKFLDGRLLRNVVFGTTWDRLGPIANLATVNAGVNVALPIPEHRALYIQQVSLLALIAANVDLEARWQIWSGGKFIIAGAWQAGPIPIEIYFPPLENVRFYYYIVNNVGANVWADYVVNWVEFDARDDKWEWGRGSQGVNPVTAPVWP